MNASVVKISKTELTYHELAMEAKKEAKGDCQVAADIFLKKIKQNHLLNDFTKMAVKEHAYNYVRQAVISERHNAFRNSEKFDAVTDSTNKRRITAFAKSVHSMYENYYLVTNNGIALLDATKTQIEAEARYYAKSAMPFVEKRNWYELIASKMKDNQRVRDAFTDEKLKALDEKAHALAE